MIELAPSLLAADGMRLGEEIQGMLDNGIRLLHYDVMDAHFVPNLSFGPSLCKAIHHQFPAVRLDVHLMMDNPGAFIQAFADAGAESITIHREIAEDVGPILQQMKDQGTRCGLSVKPGTGADTLFPYLDQLDSILIMTVEPGFGGQKFMPEQMEKIRMLRKEGFQGIISIDGGVNLQNAPLLAQAGATRLVMGTAYFRAADPAAVARAVEELV
ncbi:MAG: ribulose-phosphate 3-epimerase [Clostridia bacterium]|nr:ribulose-phosphate 3-epimerase [Clostridia bacterium]